MAPIQQLRDRALGSVLGILYTLCDKNTVFGSEAVSAAEREGRQRRAYPGARSNEAIFLCPIGRRAGVAE